MTASDVNSPYNRNAELTESCLSVHLSLYLFALQIRMESIRPAGLKSRDYSERLKELGLITMEERRHQLDMVQVYKIVNGVEE